MVDFCALLPAYPLRECNVSRIIPLSEMVATGALQAYGFVPGVQRDNEVMSSIINTPASCQDRRSLYGKSGERIRDIIK
jgi:hypothetical protein